MEVDVKNAVVGTVIEFANSCDGGTLYDLKLEKDGEWRCWHHGRHGEENCGAVWAHGEIIRKLKDGRWIVKAVQRPAPEMKAKTQAYKMSHTAKRLGALGKLGVTTTFRPDGWVIFSSDWCRLEVSPDSEFPEGLKKAEVLFGKN